jgi:hypothetical protein
VKRTEALPLLPLAWVRFPLLAPHLPPKAVLLPRVVARLLLPLVLLLPKVLLPPKVLLLLPKEWLPKALPAKRAWKALRGKRVQLTPPL